MLPFIDLAAQQAALRPQLDRRIQAVLAHGQYILGPEVTELEERLAAYTGSAHCVSVASGTDALLLALMALHIGPGDEVITTPFSFIATAEAIALVGAKPVFVDIQAGSYNLDPSHIEAAITPHTRAILPVGLYGQCADMDAINAIADQHGLTVIEDAAQSFGATHNGRRSGALSTIGCTSFFPAKPLGGYGEGGACFTDDPALAETLAQLRNHGQDRRYHHARLGLNARLDTLQAAILLVKLEVFPQEVAERARIGARYSRQIDALGLDLTTPLIAPGNTSVYAQYTLQVPQRDRLQATLSEQGVPTAVHYPIPLHRQPVFDPPTWPLPQAEAAAQRVVSLPMHPYLDNDTQDRIVAALPKSIGSP